MLKLRSSELFLPSDLVDINPENNRWFRDESREALVGRCLLDVLEYLHAIPQFSGQFRQVTNAHAIRLICRCLSDKDLDRRQLRERMKPRILDTCRSLRATRNDKVSYYGDDFWDWAAVLEAFAEVHTCFPNAGIDEAAFSDELSSFFDSVEAKVETGLTVLDNAREWYGPATAAIAYRVLSRFRDRFNGRVDEVIAKLRVQALTPIENGTYFGRVVVPYQVLWHYGQVVNEFPRAETKQQAQRIADLTCLEQTPDAADRVYALARVLQGAHKINDKNTIKNATVELYKCQDLARPLGQGLMGDNVKGSLNVLEALWPRLEPGQKTKIRQMIDTFLQVHAVANTIGVVVAIDHEVNAATKAFSEAGARIAKKNQGTTIIEHADYRVVVCQGKGLIGAIDATRTLIDDHEAKWLLMFGIAGSLGTTEQFDGKGSQFRGPDKGHVVAASSLAPFRIYDKIREAIENAKVPFRGRSWMIIPTDPTLFGLAHEAAEELFSKTDRFHEGLIVTGTGVKDSLKVQGEILYEFPGGLAVETEGYVVGILAMHSGVPYLIIRGISDRARGDKEEQRSIPAKEAEEQFGAAFAAAKLTVRLVELLSQRCWGC